MVITGMVLLITGIALTTPTPSQSLPRSNPALHPWPGPFGGVPPFEDMVVSDLKPALEGGMAEQTAALLAITENPAVATFNNTLAPLEKAGRTMKRASAVFGIYTSTLNDPTVQSLEREMAPLLAAFSDQITQNSTLFKRIEAVYATRSTSGLSPEQQRLVWLYHTEFVKNGARLDGPAKLKLSALNQQLATLYTDFSQNILADQDEQKTLLTTESELAGLPDAVRAGAAADAARTGHPGQWVIGNNRASVESFLTYSTRRDLREKVWRTFVHRGDNPGVHNNNQIISNILFLRAQRAKLLGFATHAHWALQDSMAGTPERAMQLMETVWQPAVAQVREEAKTMQAVADRMGSGGQIEPWDYRFYGELVRQENFSLDAKEMEPYLQLENLREGLFFVAGKLLGLSFKPLTTGLLTQGHIPVYHPDVSVYQVTDRAGETVGLWYFDPWARPGKNSGAWMNAYRDQERFDGKEITIVSNNANFIKGATGKPALISWEDALTMFHEFGHALHGLSSNVSYPSLSGTNVATDYVEFPSQLLEHWLYTPEVLGRYALNYKTGRPMPGAMIAAIRKSEMFMQGFQTVEYLSSALIDMKLHLAGETRIDPKGFEKATLVALGMPEEVSMRHRTAHFSHVFSDDGYAAGYYSYLWADTLTADAYEAFSDAQGPYDPAVAKRLYEEILSKGNTVNPADAYQAFRGRDPDVGALLRKLGFASRFPARASEGGKDN